MLFTYKSFWRIFAMCIVYFFLGSISLALSVAFSFGTPDLTLFWLGISLYALIPIFAFWLRSAEGKGKPLALGYRLLRRDMRPAAFLAEYEALKNAPDLMICRPSTDLLQMVAVAESMLGHTDRALATVEEMIATAPKKKLTYAKMVKVSFLFVAGKIEEAEALLFTLRTGKLDILSQTLASAILEGDRAMAIGDYKTVEASRLRQLDSRFPKLDNLGRLAVHYDLAEIYMKMGNTESATLHYRFCAENGGETVLRENAIAALEWLR